MTSLPLSDPNGRRILIVEDEFLLAMDLEQMFQQGGVTVVGPVATVSGALRLLDDDLSVDAAVLDVNLGGEMIFPVVDRLTALSVPIVLVTGYGEADLPARYQHIPRCEKPIEMERLAAALGWFLQDP